MLLQHAADAKPLLPPFPPPHPQNQMPAAGTRPSLPAFSPPPWRMPFTHEKRLPRGRKRPDTPSSQFTKSFPRMIHATQALQPTSACPARPWWRRAPAGRGAGGRPACSAAGARCPAPRPQSHWPPPLGAGVGDTGWQPPPAPARCLGTGRLQGAAQAAQARARLRRAPPRGSVKGEPGGLAAQGPALLPLQTAPAGSMGQTHAASSSKMRRHLTCGCQGRVEQQLALEGGHRCGHEGADGLPFLAARRPCTDRGRPWGGIPRLPGLETLPDPGSKAGAEQAGKQGRAGQRQRRRGHSPRTASLLPALEIDLRGE